MRLATDSSEADGDVCVMVEDNCIIIWNIGYPLLQVFRFYFYIIFLFNLNSTI